MLGPAVALGLARFAYGLLLPSMRADLGWSYSVAGVMNTANALGYLAGALATATLFARSPARPTFVWSMVVTGLALAGGALSGAFPVLLVLRLVAGAAGALTFIVGAGLAAQASHRATSQTRSAFLLSVYFAGGGLGIVVSGLLVPAVLAATGSGGWRWGWLALGGLALIATAAVTPVLRDHTPLPAAPVEAGRASQRWEMRRIAFAMAGYFLFGAGYIGYITFVVAFVRQQGAGTVEVTLFWTVLGTACMLSIAPWTPVLARFGGGEAAALATGVAALGALIPLLNGGAVGVFTSALVFGGSFLTVPTAVTALARRMYPPHHWTPVIAGLTVAFAVGQSAGPVLAGIFADSASGVRAGLSISVALLAAGAVVSAVQPDRDGRRGLRTTAA